MRSIRLAVAFVLAGHGLAVADPTADQLRAAIASRDTFVAVLADPIAIAGITFDTEACVKRFGAPRAVARAEQAALYDCLHAQDVSFIDRDWGVMMVYGPLMLATLALDHGKIRGLGPYAANRNDAALPTVALHDDRFVPSEPVSRALTASNQQVAAAIKLCATANGTVTSVRLAESSGTPAFDRDALAFYASTKQIPVHMQLGTPIAACGVINASFPPISPPPPPSPDTIAPPAQLETLRIAGEKRIAPDEATRKQIIADKRDRVVGSFKLCLDTAGTPTTTRVLKSTGYPAYDDRIRNTILGTWRYAPFVIADKPVPVCTAVTFIYSP
jgi:TonB family protein